MNHKKLYSEVISEWFKEIKYEVEEVTFQSYEFYASRHIIPYFNGYLVTDINKSLIRSFINDKLENGRLDGKGGLSSNTISKFYVVIKMSLEYAEENEYIDRNPAQNIKMPRKNKFVGKYLTECEVNNMLETLEYDRFYYIIVITLALGLRRSEMLALKWDCVDFDNNKVFIKRTISKCTKSVEKEKTKNQSSKREYSLTPEIMNIFTEIKEAQKINSERYGREYVINDYVFTEKNGNQYNPDYISKHFSELLSRHNLKIIRFHDLRHTCGSLLYNNDNDLKRISDWLGHSSIKTTANVYIHCDEDKKKATAKELSCILKIA